MAKLISFGSVNVDLSARVQQLPRPGETVAAQSLDITLGGKGANQAVAAALSAEEHTSVAMVATLGNDSFADFAERQLQSHKVDTANVQRSASSPTGIALIHVDAAAENCITVAAGANAQLRADSCLALLGTAQALLLQLETPLAQVLALAQAAAKQQLLTILDPAPAQELPKELLLAVDILTPNETEATTLLRKRGEPMAMAQELHALGARQVIVKCSAAGIAYAGEMGNGSLPAFAVDSIDSVAAGDAFNGALAAALVSGVGFSQALCFASAAGALATTKAGAAQAMASHDEIQNLLSQHG